MYPELFRIGNFPDHHLRHFFGGGDAARSFCCVAARGTRRFAARTDLRSWPMDAGRRACRVKAADVFCRGRRQLFSLDFLRSGGVFYGGLILADFLQWSILVQFYKLPFWKVSDAFAPGLALGQAFGRQGCFSAGCCWGKPTTLPWGVHFTEAGHEYTGVPIYGPDGHDLFLHPTQLYESFIMLAVFGIYSICTGTKNSTARSSSRTASSTRSSDSRSNLSATTHAATSLD